MKEQKMKLFEQIEKARKSKLLVYVTGDRPAWETQIADDATDFFTEHLEKTGSVDRITLFLYSNGDSTLAAWNIVNLIRQFCNDFEIIVPSKARSAATLMCLGADRIIMTKQATLGPIDPCVNNELNPIVPGVEPKKQIPVSVEAIKGYLELAQHELKISDGIALASIMNTLSERVHPLVLGEVYRALGQIRMLAEKLIKHQKVEKDKVEGIVSFLCSESGSHDYTIDRREAQEIGLSIEKPDEVLYGIIKETFEYIKKELNLRVPFNLNAHLGSKNETQYTIERVFIESIAGGTDYFVSEGNLTRMTVRQENGVEKPGINDCRNFEGWKHRD